MSDGSVARDGGMEALKSSLRAIIILLGPFQDSGLQAVAQKAGAYLSLPPIFLLMLIEAVGYFRRGGPIEKKYILLGVYVIAVTFFGIFIYGAESHRENLILKGLKQVFYFSPALYVMYKFDVNDKYVVPAIWGAMAIFIAGFIICDFMRVPGTGPGSFFHYTIETNGRPRSFSLEASTAGVTMGALLSLCLFLARKNITRIMVGLVFVAVMLAARSKGGMAAVIMSLVLAILLTRCISLKRRVALVAVSMVMAVPFAFLVVSMSAGAFSEIGEGGTTFATRGTLYIMPWLVAFTYPLGVGPSAFLPVFSEFGPKAMGVLEDLIALPLDYSEVSAYFVGDSAAAVDAKTFFGNMVIYFGFPFVIWFVWFLRRLYRENISVANGRYIFLSMGIIFTTISYCTYASEINLLFSPLIYAFALRRKVPEMAPSGTGRVSFHQPANAVL